MRAWQVGTLLGVDMLYRWHGMHTNPMGLKAGGDALCVWVEAITVI